jgi:hypothetical protein
MDGLLVLTLTQIKQTWRGSSLGWISPSYLRARHGSKAEKHCRL